MQWCCLLHIPCLGWPAKAGVESSFGCKIFIEVEMRSRGSKCQLRCSLSLEIKVSKKFIPYFNHQCEAE